MNGKKLVIILLVINQHKDVLINESKTYSKNSMIHQKEPPYMLYITLKKNRNEQIYELSQAGPQGLD